ncbi:response regulator [uncultured Jatrophihabitans sp.]|uniref:response regulator n=1 Tax=uncultured Jatrophihabitans sp. TaxID=1610747 RepID=UPI0035CC3E0D
MKALIIDDSRAMRMLVRKIVTANGFDALEAGNGKEALEILDAGTVPEVALIDWNMPVMNGLEFVNAVRARPEFRDITLMMVTTESERSQIVRALAAGAHEYLIKPFTEDAMVAKLSMLGLVPDTGEVPA